MKLDASDIDVLRPVIDAAVRATLERIASENLLFGQQLGYSEPEAATLVGVQSHVLRDCRLRGEIRARKVGKRYIYSRDALSKFLGAKG